MLQCKYIMCSFVPSLSPGNSILASYFASKILAFKTPLPLGISNDLPWGGYGFLLELHNLFYCLYVKFVFSLLHTFSLYYISVNLIFTFLTYFYDYLLVNGGRNVNCKLCNSAYWLRGNFEINLISIYLPTYSYLPTYLHVHVAT